MTGTPGTGFIDDLSHLDPATRQAVADLAAGTAAELSRHAGRPVTVYVSIGNSDDKLSQARWSQFWEQATFACRRSARRVYGDWQSASTAGFQNACICIDLVPDHVPALKRELADLAAIYGQDSIAWAEAVTEFIGPRILIVHRTDPARAPAQSAA